MVYAFKMLLAQIGATTHCSFLLYLDYLRMSTNHISATATDCQLCNTLFVHPVDYMTTYIPVRGARTEDTIMRLGHLLRLLLNIVPSGRVARQRSPGADTRTQAPSLRQISHSRDHGVI